MIILFHLFLTLAVELLIYGLGDRFKYKSMTALFMGNIVLNLTMNMLASEFNNHNAYLTFIICAEIFTFITEGFLYFLFSEKKLWYCLLIAFTANISSLAIGNIFNQTGLVYKNDVVLPIIVICIVITISEVLFSYFLLFRLLYRRSNDERKEA